MKFRIKTYSTRYENIVGHDGWVDFGRQLPTSLMQAQVMSEGNGQLEKKLSSFSEEDWREVSATLQGLKSLDISTSSSSNSAPTNTLESFLTRDPIGSAVVSFIDAHLPVSLRDKNSKEGGAAIEGAVFELPLEADTIPDDTRQPSNDEVPNATIPETEAKHAANSDCSDVTVASLRNEIDAEVQLTATVCCISF